MQTERPRTRLKRTAGIRPPAGVAVKAGLDLIDGIYAVAEERGGWSEFLVAASEHLRCDAASLEDVEIAAPTPRLADFGGMPESAVLGYRREWFAHNPLRTRAGEAAQAGRLAPGARLEAADEIRNSPYYNGFLAPLGLGHAAAACVAVDGPRAWLFGLLRREGRRAFGTREHEACSDLIPHLRRALAQRQRAERQRDLEETLTRLAGAVDSPLFVLDHHGQIVRANSLGQQLLDRRDGLASYHGTLVGPHDQQGLVARAVEEACGGAACANRGPATGAGSAVVVAVPRPGCAPLTLAITALRPGEPHAAALAVVVAPAAPPPAAGVDPLARTFGLTPTEIRIARLLPEYTCVRELAASLGSTYQTVRTHLNHIYAKTGVGGQRGLVRLVVARPVGWEG